MSSGGMSVPLSATVSGDRSGSNLALRHHRPCHHMMLLSRLRPPFVLHPRFQGFDPPVNALLQPREPIVTTIFWCTSATSSRALDGAAFRIPDGCS